MCLFGYPPRHFASFYEAADEAAYSRIYGGIHYVPSCELAKEQGLKLGKMVVERIQMRE